MRIHNPSVTGSLLISGSITSTDDITTLGTLTAQRYIVSSSVTNMTTTCSSGSTIFGD